MVLQQQTEIHIKIHGFFPEEILYFRLSEEQLQIITAGIIFRSLPHLRIILLLLQVVINFLEFGQTMLIIIPILMVIKFLESEGRPDTTFNLIFSCNKNDVVHSYDDQNAKRGFNYFYYIVTKDDGSTNSIQPGVPLISSKYYTVTNHEAFNASSRRTRPARFFERIYKLSEIRIVPNPYNIKAKSLQFGNDTPDRLAFYGLPPFCQIKIYTENGDLIESIDHSNGSGDELWHSLTSSRQIVVSGLYIAYFEVTEDTYDSSGKLIYKQGENTIKKFIIIR